MVAANSNFASLLRLFLVRGFPSRWCLVFEMPVCRLYRVPLVLHREDNGGHWCHCPLAALCLYAPFAENPPELVAALGTLALRPHLLGVRVSGEIVVVSLQTGIPTAAP